MFIFTKNAVRNLFFIFYFFVSSTYLQAKVGCDTAALAPAFSNAQSASGRQYLGQGIALFDANNFSMAERAFQTALSTGLTEQQERAAAHKYLAFIYCKNNDWSRCESQFDAAFVANSGFHLADYEVQNTPWRDAYFRAQAEWARRCGKQPINPSLYQVSATAPVSFKLNSSVVAVVAPLAPAPFKQKLSPFSNTAMGAGGIIRSDKNVHFRAVPWAHIQINGKRMGVSPPLTALKLSPGTYTVELSNPGFETFRQVVRVVDGEIVKVSHDFDAR